MTAGDTGMDWLGEEMEPKAPPSAAPPLQAPASKAPTPTAVAAESKPANPPAAVSTAAEEEEVMCGGETADKIGRW